MDTSVPRSAPSLNASISPPFAVTKAFAIHRPRPDPDTFDACRPPPTKEPFPKTHPFLSNEADAFVLDRQHHRVAVASRGNGDRRARMRILRRVVDDLPERLFNQDGVNVDEGQFVRNI